MHDAAYAWVAAHAPDRRPLSVVEIGARNVNTTVRPLFDGAEYWGIDAQPGPCVDEVADGATWQPAAPVDLVVCAEVAEHTPTWREILANAYRMLRPGGSLIFTAAGPGRPVHGLNIDDPLHPGWYENIDPSDLYDALAQAGFSWWGIDVLADDVRAVAWQ